MNEHGLINILSGAGGTAGSLLRATLRAASAPYATAMRLRRYMYKRGLLKSIQATVPVICVGNITTGGTGKTPMVAWVVRRLKELGKTPAVLTRGYKAAGGLSDEAELLRQLTDAETAIIVNADRAAGAETAIAAGADVLVMDDGFQHCRLARDLDIVLIDATRPFGFGACLPRGLLREPLSALSGAGAVVVTRSDHVTSEAIDAIRERLAPLLSPPPTGGVPVSLAVHRPTGVVDENGTMMTPETLHGQEVFAFCGIGQPEAFFETLSRMGAKIIGRLALEDHARYDDDNLRKVSAAASASGATVLITTQKDAVKLEGLGQGQGQKLWKLAVEMDVVEGRDELVEKIRRAADCTGRSTRRSTTKSK